MKKELTKEDLIEEVVKAAKEDDTFMCKVGKAIEESKIISAIEAKEIAKRILQIINVNPENLKGNIIISTVNFLKDYICIHIGQYYMFRPLEEFNSSILSGLSYICGRIKKEEFNDFKKYVEYNYPGLTMIDIFEEKEKALQRVKNGQKYPS